MSKDKKLDQEIDISEESILKESINEEIKEEESKEEVSKEVKEEEVKNIGENEKKSNKIKGIIITVVIGILCIGAGFVSGKEVGRKLPATSKNYSSNKVVATVGETKITGADLKKKMEPLFYLNGKTALTEDQITAYESSMISYMTTTEVLYLEGLAEKIEASEEEINEEYESLMTEVSKEFEMTEEEYLKKFNITKDDIKKELEKEIIATKYMAKASEVSDKEAQSYYDKNKDEFLQVRASHILIKNVDDEGNEVSDDQKKENKAKAEDILKKAKEGVDFATLAKEYSEDSSASNGGDLDFFGKGKMVEPFEEAVFALKIGNITENLVESDFGYHIIKKTDEKYSEFDDIKEDLKYTLSYEKQNNLLSDLMEKYNVDVTEK